jgi:hypothetical protein
MTDQSKPLYTFTVLEGEHHGYRRIYKKNETFQSELELDKLFVGKFSRMTDKDIPVDSPKAKQLDTRLSFVFADAQDITASFPLAVQNELKVFKNGQGGHVIVSALDKSSEPANLADTILGSKKLVSQWLVAYVERIAKG